MVNWQLNLLIALQLLYKTLMFYEINDSKLLDFQLSFSIVWNMEMIPHQKPFSGFCQLDSQMEAQNQIFITRNFHLSTFFLFTTREEKGFLYLGLNWTQRLVEKSWSTLRFHLRINPENICFLFESKFEFPNCKGCVWFKFAFKMQSVLPCVLSVSLPLVTLTCRQSYYIFSYVKLLSKNMQRDLN